MTLMMMMLKKAMCNLVMNNEDADKNGLRDFKSSMIVICDFYMLFPKHR